MNDVKWIDLPNAQSNSNCMQLDNGLSKGKIINIIKWTFSFILTWKDPICHFKYTWIECLTSNKFMCKRNLGIFMNIGYYEEWWISDLSFCQCSRWPFNGDHSCTSRPGKIFYHRDNCRCMLQISYCIVMILLFLTLDIFFIFYHTSYFFNQVSHLIYHWSYFFIFVIYFYYSHLITGIYYLCNFTFNTYVSTYLIYMSCITHKWPVENNFHFK